MTNIERESPEGHEQPRVTPIHSLGQSAAAFANAVSRAMETDLSHEGLTPLQFAMIKLFLTDEEWTVTKLADVLPVEVPAISRHVTRLVDRGILYRSHLRSDRRYVLLKLTEEGRKLALELQGKEHLYEEGLVEGIDEVEVEAFLSTIRKILENSEDNAGLAADCETLLSLRDELAGEVVLINWSPDVSMTGWDGVAAGGAPMRVTALDLDGRMLSGTIPSDIGLLTGIVKLDLSENLLTGPIPSELGSLTRLRELSLSENALTGAIPPALESLSDLHTLHLSGNALSGCVPGDLRQVAVNDLTELDIPHCDVLLRFLDIRPGELNQQFDPYRRNYTAMSYSSRITVGAISEAGTTRYFLDNLSRHQPDADTDSLGHQVDTGPGVTFTRVRVVSSDQEAQMTYTMLVANAALFGRYDDNDNRVIEGDEVLRGVRDYFAGSIGREEVIGLVQLYFFEN